MEQDEGIKYKAAFCDERCFSAWAKVQLLWISYTSVMISVDMIDMGPALA